jgi:hypothetical protein
VGAVEALFDDLTDDFSVFYFFFSPSSSVEGDELARQHRHEFVLCSFG